MPRKLHLLAILQLQHLLEFPAQIHKHLPRLLRRTSLPTRHIAVPTSRNALADRLGPQSQAVEALADIHHNTHDLAVIIIGFEGLANGGEHEVEPELVDGDGTLFFELVGPFAPVLVLEIFPFGPDALLEEVVVGFEGEFGGGADVVLRGSEKLSVRGQK